MKPFLFCWVPFMLASGGLSAQTQQPTEPPVQRIVVQDDQVRVEEERVRGVTRRVVVKPKDAAAYEVIPSTPARDPSQPARGNDGKRAWNVLKF
jgi:hypothetical protein